MSKIKEPINPFYLVLVVVGVAFLVTAIAFEVMAWRSTRPHLARDVAGAPPDGAAAAGGDAAGVAERHPLMVFLGRHGVELLTWELVALATATFAAMWLDRRRARRQAADRDPGAGR